MSKIYTFEISHEKINNGQNILFPRCFAKKAKTLLEGQQKKSKNILMKRNHDFWKLSFFIISKIYRNTINFVFYLQEIPLKIVDKIEKKIGFLRKFRNSCQKAWKILFFHGGGFMLTARMLLILIFC